MTDFGGEKVSLEYIVGREWRQTVEQRIGVMKNLVMVCGEQVKSDLVMDSHYWYLLYKEYERLVKLGEKAVRMGGGRWADAKEAVRGEIIHEAIGGAEKEYRLKKEAVVDDLTGLFNRRGLGVAFQGIVAAEENRGGNVGVLILDLDHFKGVNDDFGHAEGNVVLGNVGGIVRDLMGEDGRIIGGRWGGEEFIIIAPEISESELEAIARRLGKEIPERTKRVTTSIGAEVFPADGLSNLDKVVVPVDALLYEAKQGGRNGLVMRRKDGHKVVVKFG